MIARSTFNTYDTFKILGTMRACQCIKQKEDVANFDLKKMSKEKTPSLSSGYSSGSSTMDNLNSPDLLANNLSQFQLVSCMQSRD